MHFTGSVNFRPVRIGFLVPGDDLSIVSRVARLSACLWGGMYNPIIPFFESGGDRWLRPYSDAKGIDIARGYVNFFDPDILVETAPGVARKLGWENTHPIMGLPRVISLDQFYELDYRGELQFAAGVDVFEVMLELYDKEYKYVRRCKPPLPRSPRPKATHSSMSCAGAIRRMSLLTTSVGPMTMFFRRSRYLPMRPRPFAI